MASNPIPAHVVSSSPVVNSAASSNHSVTPTQSEAPIQQPAVSQLNQDTVKLSGAALARSLKLAGKTPAQIAMKMGVNIKTVYKYLGKTPPPDVSAPTVQNAATNMMVTPQQSSLEEASESAAQKESEG